MKSLSAATDRNTSRVPLRSPVVFCFTRSELQYEDDEEADERKTENEVDERKEKEKVVASDEKKRRMEIRQKRRKREGG